MNKSMVGLLVVSIACLVTVGSIVLSKRVGEDLKATDLPTATISIPNTETPESQLTSTPEPTIGYRSIKIIPTGVPTDATSWPDPTDQSIPDDIDFLPPGSITETPTPTP